MTDPDDIPTRVTHLEQEMIHARRDAAAARALAGGADRDVSQMQQELRAHTRTLNALRETQVEHGQEMREGFRKVDEKFKQVDTNFKRIDTNFKRIDANFRQVDENFRTIEGKFSTVNTGIARITELLTKESDEE